MKLNKLLASAIIASTLFATVSESFAGSIGRSSSSSSSSRSSSSSSSKSSFSSAPAPRPSPAAAPAPSKPGGIGGTTSSVGVRKSEVTNGVRNDVAAGKPAPPAGSTGAVGSASPGYATAPGYSAPPVPAPSVGGSGFGSSFLGAMGGVLVGNALFSNHGSNGSGTTVINNGTPSGGSGSVQAGPGVSSNDSQFNPGGMPSAPKKEYTVWSFIADVFGFVIVVALLLGIAWLFYKGFQLVRKFINKERGVSTQPFNPTQQFWTIQTAFATAEVTALQTLLGPDIVDELTRDLQPSGLTIKNVSHEVRLANNTEFSIWYKFYETDGEEISQVWHYEKFGRDWKLNGIENV